jgi:hydroxypyruvate isomerase
LLAKNKLELVLVNAPSGSSNDQKVRGLAAWPSKQAEFRSCFSVALDYAKALRVPLIHATAGPVLPQIFDIDTALALDCSNLI